VKPIDASKGISELFRDGDRKRVRKRIERPFLTWRNFFLAVDHVIKAAEAVRLLPFRGKAVRKAEKWLLERMNFSSGLGAIFPPIVYSLIALRALRYPDDHPEVVRAMAELEKLEIEEQATMRLQPCMSPVWDTAIAVNALAAGGVEPNHPAILHAAEWLVAREVRMRGDWSAKRPRLEPGGWYFEFENEFYPDIDDTAMVLMALANSGAVEGKEDACRRGLGWILGMQGRDGGWASFDVDNNNAVFNDIPFADHNAMLDPSTSDITARMLEMFSYYAVTCDSRTARRAMAFLKSKQEPDGSWYGRWGVNYIYGTWQAIRGLTAIGVDPADPMVRRAAQWLEGTQNPDGGWGETCRSYDDPSTKGEGPSTASQTAWAVMGLICAGRAHGPPVRRGVDFLLNTQRPDGTWDERLYTGAGFPKVFYLQYHLYRHSFPLMALGMWRGLAEP
jgi:squalene-hopene/tetraprenyl-beta-curcumene cyclase